MSRIVDKVSKLLFQLRVIRFISHFTYNCPVSFDIKLNVEGMGIIMNYWKKEKINSPFGLTEKLKTPTEKVIKELKRKGKKKLTS